VSGSASAQAGEERQVVLRLVDRVLGTRRRRPAEPAAERLPAALLQLVEAREPPRRRAQRLEPVERRHSRTRLLDVHARPREDEPLACRAGGEPEREALGSPACGLRDEAGRVQRAAARVEEDRVLDDLPREELLGQPGHEDDVEREAACRLRRRHEDRAVAPTERRHGQLAEARPEDEAHLVEVDRADGPHRLELGERREHALGLAERGRGELAEMDEPLGPPRLLRERVQPLDQRQRDGPEVRQVRDLALERGAAALRVLVTERFRRRRSSSRARRGGAASAPGRR
jgi:hypothetical protein